MPISTGCRAPAELAELGFDDLPEGAVVLLEWPDRAAGFLPPDRLDIALTLAPKLKLEFRHARITGYGTLGAARRPDGGGAPVHRRERL